MCSAKLVAKAARLAGISKASLAPKTRLAKPLRGAGGGGIQRAVPNLVGRSSGAESVVPLANLRAGRVRASFVCCSRNGATFLTLGRVTMKRLRQR